MKKDYTKYSNEDLNKLLEDFRMRVMKTYGFMKKGEKAENRKQLRKEISRIETELRRRKNEM